MGIIENLSEALVPHSAALNRTLAIHGAALNHRLGNIESRLSDLGRPSVGDSYFRQVLLKKFAAGSTDLFTVPSNEIWPLQFITLNGETLKTPAFTITANGVIILAFKKEGVGTETLAGNVFLLPGEKVAINMAEEGTVEGTIGLIRVRRTDNAEVVDYGRSEELLAGRNTHEPGRDVIASPDGLWESSPPEVVDSGGSPAIAR